jgi:hypothetical protein
MAANSSLIAGLTVQISIGGAETPAWVEASLALAERN